MSRQQGYKRKRRQVRRARLFERTFHSEERVIFIKSLPCEVTGKVSTTPCSSPVVNAHMKSRGAGGTYRDIVPLSWEVHLDFDVMGALEFERRWGRSKQSIRDRAPHYQRLWEEQG